MNAPWTKWNDPVMKSIKPSIRKRYYNFLMGNTTLNKEDVMSKKEEKKESMMDQLKKVNKTTREALSTITKKEENVKKDVKIVEHKGEQGVATIIVRKQIKRVRAPKLYENLIPGTKEWMKVWKEHKELQQEMLVYKNKNFTEDNTVNKLKEEKMKEEAAVDKFMREKIEKSIKKYKGKLGKVAKALEMTREILDRNMKKYGISSGKGEAAFIIEDDDDDDDGYTIVEEVKEKPRMKVVKKPEVRKSVKEEVISTIGKAFGSEGRTIDNYAIDLPEELQRHARPIAKWVMKNVVKTPYLLEIDPRTGNLKVYNTHERRTESGRIAVLTAKKQGERVLASFRSNKNSRHDEDD